MFLFLRIGKQCESCGSTAVSPAAVPAPTPTPPMAPMPPGNAAGSYDIQLQILNVPSTDKIFFDATKSRWESVIAADLENQSSANLADLGGGCTYPTSIDDLYICAKCEKIDVDKGVVGFAGPSYNRADGTSYVCTMAF